jgi:hypothetical protein
VAVSVLIVPSPPNTNASLTKLSSFYTHSKVAILHIDAIITGVAVVVGVFWFLVLPRLADRHQRRRSSPGHGGLRWGSPWVHGVARQIR